MLDHGLPLLMGNLATPVLPVRLFRAVIQSSPFPEKLGVSVALNCPGVATKESRVCSEGCPLRRNIATT